MQDLVIFGCGGVGRYVVQAIHDINKIQPTWNIIGFVDEDNGNNGKTISGFPVLGGLEWMRNNIGIPVVVAIFEPLAKKRIVSELNKLGVGTFPEIIHPHTWIADSVKIGEGSILYPGSSVNIDVVIGRFASVNMNCAIGHDVKIEDFASIAPDVGIGGNTILGEGSMIGIGSSIIQSINIGSWSIVGAGSVVVKDVLAGSTVAGVPARELKNGGGEK
jgi:sugar O-acyltransferase (sialic acid O-acetyltransferase NeuD family)